MLGLIFEISFIFLGSIYAIVGIPMPNSAEIESSVQTSGAGIPPLLSFKEGNVGVNFLGFKASAGLGGLLSGDSSQGGLHAEAETPFGQKAGAGLGGAMGRDGKAYGGLYAGATAGGGIGAAAGLGGSTGASGSSGASYAGASAGGISKVIVKERTAPASAASSADFSGSVNIQKIPHQAAPLPPASIVQAPEAAGPAAAIDIHATKYLPVPPPPSPPLAAQSEVLKKTYIERTIIPNYVEKTIHVPSYVEKTIKVPTLVEKRIQVPVPPTIIEKEVEIPQEVQPVNFSKTKVIHKEQLPNVAIVTKTKTKLRRRPWFHLNKQIQINNDQAPGYSGYDNGATASAAAAAATGGYSAGGNGGINKSYSATFTKSYNGGDLVRNIFNIPIATLGAVSNLVSGVVGDTAGSISISKSASVSAASGK